MTKVLVSQLPASLGALAIGGGRSRIPGVAGMHACTRPGACPWTRLQVQAVASLSVAELFVLAAACRRVERGGGRGVNLGMVQEEYLAVRDLSGKDAWPPHAVARCFQRLIEDGAPAKALLAAAPTPDRTAGRYIFQAMAEGVLAARYLPGKPACPPHAVARCFSGSYRMVHTQRPCMARVLAGSIHAGPRWLAAVLKARRTWRCEACRARTLAAVRRAASCA